MEKRMEEEEEEAGRRPLACVMEARKTKEKKR
jgi:hypothetical protein